MTDPPDDVDPLDEAAQCCDMAHDVLTQALARLRAAGPLDGAQQERRALMRREIGVARDALNRVR